MAFCLAAAPVSGLRPNGVGTVRHADQTDECWGGSIRNSKRANLEHGDAAHGARVAVNSLVSPGHWAWTILHPGMAT